MFVSIINATVTLNLFQGLIVRHGFANYEMLNRVQHDKNSILCQKNDIQKKYIVIYLFTVFKQ